MSETKLIHIFFRDTFTGAKKRQERSIHTKIRLVSLALGGRGQSGLDEGHRDFKAW